MTTPKAGDVLAANERFPSRPHQLEGTKALATHKFFALFDDVGGGKSKQVIDAASLLYHYGHIDAVLVLTPGSARSVWCDLNPALGEVAKHAWPKIRTTVTEYHSDTEALPLRTDALDFVVTNYEFIIRKPRLEPLVEWVQQRRVMLVLDESWMVSNPKAQRTKVCLALSKLCARRYILNGTPGDPGKLFSQFQILEPGIIGLKNFFTFRARYAKMGGFGGKEIVGWRNMDELQKRTAPFVLRRRTRDVFEMGAEPTRTQIDVRLTPETWRHYEEMRRYLVTQLSSKEAAVANMAATKTLRLAQILSGFVGGIETEIGVTTAIRDIGFEKDEAVVAWLRQQEQLPNKLVLWGQFRHQIERLAQRLLDMQTGHMVRLLYGGQTDDERREIKALLAPGGDSRPAWVVGHPASGGAGLHFGSASTALYVTNGHSFKDRRQSEGRIDRPGQVGHPIFIDLLAHGPQGQRTIDHHVVAALRREEELADWTAAKWKAVLTEE